MLVSKVRVASVTPSNATLQNGNQYCHLQLGSVEEVARLMELDATKRGEALLGLWRRANVAPFVIESPRDVTARPVAGLSVVSVGIPAGEQDDAADITSLNAFFELGGCVRDEGSSGDRMPATRA